jgi:outer membrane protein assembly factor BamB
MGATLSVTTGWREQFTSDGQLYFTFVKNTGAEVTLEVTFEHDSTAVTEIAAWRAQTQRNVQLKFTGSTIAGGSDFAGKALVINLTGKWERFDKIDERDGNDIVTGTLRMTYNAESGINNAIIVACSLATIP